MYKLSLLLIVIAASLTLLGSNRQEPAKGSADLPPGPMQEKANTACLVCHDASIITQQRLTKEAWTKEVDKMIKWGSQIEPSDRQALIDYFSANFPPDKPAQPAVRAGKAK